LDLRTGYEVVLVFPKEQMNEPQMIEWFNSNGVGKEGRDNGAAVFVLPDNAVFVSIGSGNDKITVTKSKTYGEKIFADFQDDPVLTLLRFLSKIGGDVDKTTAVDTARDAGKTLIDNIDVVLLWISAMALILFLIQQYDGFQPSDLILPAGAFVLAMLVVGIMAIGGGGEAKDYVSYGMITSSNRDSYTWVHTHTVCTTTGKTTTCTSYSHVHTTYTNEVGILSYELNSYGYKFSSDQSRSAWEHDIGEVDWLKIGIDDGNLKSAGRARESKKSSGVTVGDGTWINSARK